MVYDPETATDNSKVNKIFIDNQMYPMFRGYSKNYLQGTGQMVVGRLITNQDTFYSAALFDDLKMWNRKLSDKEIAAISNWILISRCNWIIII